MFLTMSHLATFNHTKRVILISDHLQAYNMFDMKVMGFTLRTMSMMYTITVGYADAC